MSPALYHRTRACCVRNALYFAPTRACMLTGCRFGLAIWMVCPTRTATGALGDQCRPARPRLQVPRGARARRAQQGRGRVAYKKPVNSPLLASWMHRHDCAVHGPDADPGALEFGSPPAVVEPKHFGAPPQSGPLHHNHRPMRPMHARSHLRSSHQPRAHPLTLTLT